MSACYVLPDSSLIPPLKNRHCIHISIPALFYQCFTRSFVCFLFLFPHFLSQTFWSSTHSICRCYYISKASRISYYSVFSSLGYPDLCLSLALLSLVSIAMGSAGNVGSKKGLACTYIVLSRLRYDILMFFSGSVIDARSTAALRITSAATLPFWTSIPASGEEEARVGLYGYPAKSN